MCGSGRMVRIFGVEEKEKGMRIKIKNTARLTV